MSISATRSAGLAMLSCVISREKPMRKHGLLALAVAAAFAAPLAEARVTRQRGRLRGLTCLWVRRRRATARYRRPKDKYCPAVKTAPTGFPNDWKLLVDQAIASNVCNQPGDNGKCNPAAP
jgi:hypothetical protein